MAYIWSYLRRYPKWLAMNFTAAILFVIANLGLPTVLARMIDDGFQCLFDFDDKSIFGLDCGNLLTFPSRSCLVCGGKNASAF